MRVGIDHTIEVTDEQRVRIANVLDGKISKRQATRAEMKDFIWIEGARWDRHLNDLFGELVGEPVVHDTEVEEDDEDLLGTPTSSESDLEDLL